jgi:hypothetical protein
MELEIVRKIRNPLKENQGLINISLNNFCEEIEDTKVKLYLKSCFKQSVEFSNIQSVVSIETKPLVQFYSLLNIAKVFVVIYKNDMHITMDEIDKMFSSHGASSIADDEVKISKTGTFIELSKIFSNFSQLPDKNYTLLSLYKRIPDLSEMLKIIFKNDVDYVSVEPGDEWMYRTGYLNTGIFFADIVLEKSEKNILDVYQNDLTVVSEEQSYIILRGKDTDIVHLRKLLSFDLNGNLFLDIQRNEINELLAMYLIFLKYSSLSRYKPVLWFDKINKNESIIVEKILYDVFTKYWSIIAKTLNKREIYLI